MSAKPLVLAFSDIDPVSAPLVGGKALSLGVLASAGFPVPEGFAVTTHAFAAHLEASGLSADVASLQAGLVAGVPEEQRLGELRARLVAAVLPGPVKAELERAFRSTFAEGVALAVRSSGTREDLEGASFAGQYETYLNVVGLEALERSLKQCWASLLQPRVLEYLRRKSLAGGELAMAVAVQRLVVADVAGVLFTVNPLSGREREAVVEAVFGLGEALVGGKVNADRFVVDVSEQKVVERTLAEKALKVVPAPQGTVEVHLAPDEARAPTLTDAQLAELARLARDLQEHAGRPVDVEWLYAKGKLYVVQSRPITRIDFAGIPGEWTTADFKDGGVSSDVCSRFMYSLYEIAFDTSMPRYLKQIRLLPKEHQAKWIELFFARPYWNLHETKKVLESVPGWNERNFDVDLGIDPPYEGSGTTTPVTLMGILRAIPVLFALEAEYEARLTADRAFAASWSERKSKFDRSPEELEAMGRAAFDEGYEELLNRFFVHSETSYFETIYNTSNSKMDFKVHFERANKAVGGDLSYLKLVSGLKNLSHMRPMFDLHERLAKAVSEQRRLSDDEVRDFAQTWRHRSQRELDIRVPRWVDDVAYVGEMMRQAEASFRPEADPRVREEQQHSEYVAEERRALAALPFWRRKAFRKKLERVRAFAWWREEMRDHSTYTYFLVRRWTQAAAKRLVADGLFERPDEVWNVAFQDVAAALRGRVSAAELRQKARDGERMVRSFRNFKNPNEIGDRYRMKEAGPPPSADALKGTACSPGRVTAVARVVKNLADADRVQAGEVLVTVFTDPGWTPLFGRLAGVVTETGGLLSHAAVISREYGIPAVLAVKGATEALRDGDTVVVDGSRGTVERVKPA